MNIDAIADPAVRPVRSRRNSLDALPCGAQCTTLSKIEHANAKKMPIRTSIFDLYKIGPGPSSSHTIGPMKICNDFLDSVRKELIPTLSQMSKTVAEIYAAPLDTGDCSPVSTASSAAGQEKPRFILRCHLHGSLSATGLGHGTHNAVIGGLLGWQPKTCDPHALTDLFKDPTTTFEFPVPELGPIHIGLDSIVWHDPADTRKLYHPNTLFLEIMTKDAFVHKGAGPDPLSEPEVPGYSTIFEREYYSVGGGFIEKKGGLAEDIRSTAPTYPFSTFEQIERHVKEAKIDVLELLLKNEEAQTQTTRDRIFEQIDEIIKVMDSSVENGLVAEGYLPGSIQLRRKAAKVFEFARQDPYEHLGFLNAYAMAASEENAAGMRVVTAPTSGSAGVIPGLLYFMKHHLKYSQEVRRASLICGCLIGLLVKHNASISGAEMGCMGEIGVASAMGAAMLVYAKRASKTNNPISTDSDRELLLKQFEAAAEIALEHHLGLTCDPIGGYVQIPCIQRNSMGAVKAYNAAVLAIASDPHDQKVSLDDIIDTVRRTGEDMNLKYKETSQGGLAVLAVARSEC